MYAVAIAFAAPPPECGPATAPTRSVPFELVGEFYGATHHQQDGVEVEVVAGGAAVVPAEGVVDVVRPLLRMGQLETVVEPSLAGPADARYLVVWWPEPYLRYPVLEAVWLRPAETLVSLLSRTREPPWSHTLECATTTAVQIYRLPPGDYPPAGLVFTEVQWTGE